LPRIVISACQGHQGKTTISLGLCAALAERGLSVQAFKKGPDYIDPSWLAAAAGRPCRNLDAFLIPPKTLVSSFQASCRGADIAVLEGVMGLYDSFDPDGFGSTAWMARLLGAPVILIVNASRMTRSVAAMINGYRQFEPETRVSGVILNHVRLPGHRRRLESAVHRYCGIPVVGCLPSDDLFAIGEQHLGLRPFRSADGAESIVRRIRDRIKGYLDLEAILAIASQSRKIQRSAPAAPRARPRGVTLGVLLDQVFNFYYPENWEALRQAGARLVFIDSLKDRTLPPIDGLYIGGGFPELFASRLAANRAMRDQVRGFVEAGFPVYAECAGLLYLCRSLSWRGRRRAMAGVLPYDVEIDEKTQGHGYVEAEVRRENRWFPLGSKVRGHQFHHSRLLRAEEAEYVFRLNRRREGDPSEDGIAYKNLFAAFTHLHASGVPEWAEAFVSLARQSRRRRISPDIPGTAVPAVSLSGPAPRPIRFFQK